MDGKNQPKEEKKEVVTEEEPISEIDLEIEDTEVVNETAVEESEDFTLNESLIRMRKLAGIIK